MFGSSNNVIIALALAVSFQDKNKNKNKKRKDFGLKNNLLMIYEI